MTKEIDLHRKLSTLGVVMKLTLDKQEQITY